MFLHNDIRTKWIDGYENRYGIREDGVVISYLFNKTIIKKDKYHKKGYKHIELHKNGKSKTFRVHRLVALAFIDNPENKKEIDHINEIKDNNHYTNLRWCTNKENTEYYNKKKYGDNWEPQCRPTTKEVQKRKDIRTRRKQDKIDAMPYGSVDEMVKSTGKPIIIDGIEFASCGSGAQYIVDSEKELGNIRTKSTISKELRKYVNGKRDNWNMYSRYSVGS